MRLWPKPSTHWRNGVTPGVNKGGVMHTTETDTPIKPGESHATKATELDLGTRLTDPSLVANPYPLYEQMRRKGPMVISPGLGVRLFTRYEDVVKLLRSPKYSAAARLSPLVRLFTPEERKSVDELLGSLSGWALFSDPPAHTRLRDLFQKAFAPTLVQGLRPAIEAATRERLSCLREGRTVDLMEELATPLPVMVIVSLLGIDSTDFPFLKKASDDIALFLGRPQRKFEVAAAARDSLRALDAFMLELVRARRNRRGEDFISQLIAADTGSGPLSDREIVGTVSLLLVAGHETTTNLIGNSLYLLLSRRERWETLCAHRSLIPNVVEESLRYESPIQYMGRVALAEDSWYGETIHRGEYVLAMVAAANRDPMVIDDPETFRLDRPASKHLAFGQGIHFCSGAPLARLEGQIVLEIATKEYPDLRMEPGPVTWRPNLGFRGLEALWAKRGDS